MGTNGNLTDFAVADLIQLNCIDRKTAKIQIINGKQKASLFFQDGEVVHADCGEMQGEDAVYFILGWNEGTFQLENGVKAPVPSISRSWSSLILEGARRLDEGGYPPTGTSQANGYPQNNQAGQQTEEHNMAQKFDEILAELSKEVTGYKSCALVDIEGINIATNSIGKMNLDLISAQVTMLLKLVDDTAEKLRAGKLEDVLMGTADTYIIMKYLPGNNQFLCIETDRKTGNLGNMRLMSKVFSERLANAMPH